MSLPASSCPLEQQGRKEEGRGEEEEKRWRARGQGKGGRNGMGDRKGTRLCRVSSSSLLPCAPLTLQSHLLKKKQARR